MSLYFFDSSGLVKRYIIEKGTTWVRATTALSAQNKIFVSALARAEVTSAFARRKREQSLSLRSAKAAYLLLKRHFAREYEVVPLGNAILERAEDLLDTHPLRAMDAIQLASALEIQARLSGAGLPPLQFVCADARLLAAAATEGLVIEDPNQHP